MAALEGLGYVSDPTYLAMRDDFGSYFEMNFNDIQAVQAGRMTQDEVMCDKYRTFLTHVLQQGAVGNQVNFPFCSVPVAVKQDLDALAREVVVVWRQVQYYLHRFGLRRFFIIFQALKEANKKEFLQEAWRRTGATSYGGGSAAEMEEYSEPHYKWFYRHFDGLTNPNGKNGFQRTIRLSETPGEAEPHEQIFLTPQISMAALSVLRNFAHFLYSAVSPKPIPLTWNASLGMSQMGRSIHKLQLPFAGRVGFRMPRESNMAQNPTIELAEYEGPEIRNYLFTAGEATAALRHQLHTWVFLQKCFEVLLVDYGRIPPQDLQCPVGFEPSVHFDAYSKDAWEYIRLYFEQRSVAKTTDGMAAVTMYPKMTRQYTLDLMKELIDGRRQFHVDRIYKLRGDPLYIRELMENELSHHWTKIPDLDGNEIARPGVEKRQTKESEIRDKQRLAIDKECFMGVLLDTHATATFWLAIADIFDDTKPFAGTQEDFVQKNLPVFVQVYRLALMTIKHIRTRLFENLGFFASPGIRPFVKRTVAFHETLAKTRERMMLNAESNDSNVAYERRDVRKILEADARLEAKSQGVVFDAKAMNTDLKNKTMYVQRLFRTVVEFFANEYVYESVGPKTIIDQLAMLTTHKHASLFLSSHVREQIADLWVLSEILHRFWQLGFPHHVALHGNVVPVKQAHFDSAVKLTEFLRGDDVEDQNCDFKILQEELDYPTVNWQEEQLLKFNTLARQRGEDLLKELWTRWDLNIRMSQSMPALLGKLANEAHLARTRTPDYVEPSKQAAKLKPSAPPAPRHPKAVPVDSRAWSVVQMVFKSTKKEFEGRLGTIKWTEVLYFFSKIGIEQTGTGGGSIRVFRPSPEECRVADFYHKFLVHVPHTPDGKSEWCRGRAKHLSDKLEDLGITRDRFYFGPSF